MLRVKALFQVHKIKFCVFVLHKKLAFLTFSFVEKTEKWPKFKALVQSIFCIVTYRSVLAAFAFVVT